MTSQTPESERFELALRNDDQQFWVAQERWGWGRPTVDGLIAYTQFPAPGRKELVKTEPIVRLQAAIPEMGRERLGCLTFPDHTGLVATFSIASFSSRAWTRIVSWLGVMTE
jgi:hypothetical protein